MKILALDSSGLVAGVAVTEDDNLLGEYTINYKKTHSQTLLPMLDEVAKMIERHPPLFIYLDNGKGRAADRLFNSKSLCDSLCKNRLADSQIPDKCIYLPRLCLSSEFSSEL